MTVRSTKGDNGRSPTDGSPTCRCSSSSASTPEQVDPYLGAFDELNAVNADEGVRWLYSFLSLDRRKSYCLYEAPNAEMILSAASAARIPADRVVEVAGRVLPTGELDPIV